MKRPRNSTTKLFPPLPSDSKSLSLIPAFLSPFTFFTGKLCETCRASARRGLELRGDSLRAPERVHPGRMPPEALEEGIPTENVLLGKDWPLFVAIIVYYILDKIAERSDVRSFGMTWSQTLLHLIFIHSECVYQL